ncbi:hypothetical protein LSAT2_005535 [Lamellibrachia satsuma]|nr:hypothetical protein LSAT2_005535 [Lamellibrachia satsuma]
MPCVFFIVTTLPPPTKPTTTTTTTTTTTPIPTTTLPQMIEGCTGRYPLDVIFALPDQAGIDDTQRSLAFIKGIVGEMEMSPVQVQVGVTPRMCFLNKAVQLNDNDNAEGFLTSLDDRQLSSSRTNIHLKYMREEGFTSKNGARRNSVKFGVLIVDNKSADRAKTLKQAYVAKGDVRLVVIGVGDHVDRSELQQIASNASYVHYVGSYKELPQLADTVIESMCNALRDKEFKRLREDEAELERVLW